MQFDNIVRNLRVLWRTDRILADIQLRHLLASFGLKALAALIAAFGLLMFEVAAYFALIQILNAIVAAALLGAANILISVVILLISARPPSSKQVDLAREVHDSAMQALQANARSMNLQFAELVRHPLQTLLPTLLVQFVLLLTKSTHKDQS